MRLSGFATSKHCWVVLVVSPPFLINCNGQMLLSPPWELPIYNQRIAFLGKHINSYLAKHIFTYCPPGRGTESVYQVWCWFIKQLLRYDFTYCLAALLHSLISCNEQTVFVDQKCIWIKIILTNYFLIYIFFVKIPDGHSLCFTMVFLWSLTLVIKVWTIHYYYNNFTVVLHCSYDCIM